MAKKLIKFTSPLDKSTIYIDVNSIHVVQEYKHHNTNNYTTTLSGNTATVSTTVANYYIPTEHPETQTVLFMQSGHKFAVTEHLMEVLALIQGKDPKPANIIFGKE